MEYDYIIIGAGSAGCVLANHLGADPTKTLLMIEAGPMDPNLMIHIPAGVHSAWRNPKLNWNFESEAEDCLDGRSVFTPRGRVLGGSSSINSMARPCFVVDWLLVQCVPLGNIVCNLAIATCGLQPSATSFSKALWAGYVLNSYPSCARLSESINALIDALPPT